MQKPIAANIRPLPRDIEQRLACGLGLDLEPWALRYLQNCQHLRRLKYTRLYITRKDRAALALCMTYPALEPIMARIETELARFEMIRMDEF